MITYVSKLDMRPGSVAPVLHVSQYDSDFQINFDLWASSGDFVIESGTTATVRGTKLDGNGYSAECTLTGNRVAVEGDIQMTAIAGDQIFEITLHNGEKELNSANFILAVERAAMDKDTFKSDSKILEAYAITDRTDEIIAAANKAESACNTVEQYKEDAVAAKDRAEEILGSIPRIRDALLTMFRYAVYKDGYSSDMYDQLYNAWHGERTLQSISAIFEQGENIVANTDSIDSLKQYLVVTALYSDGETETVEEYTLSGTLNSENSEITVTYSEKIDTFVVNVSMLPSGYTHYNCVVTDGTQYMDSGISEIDMQDCGIKLKEAVTQLAESSGHVFSSRNFYSPFLWVNSSLSSRNVNAARFGNQLPQPQNYERWALNEQHELTAYMNGGNGISLDGEEVYTLEKGSSTPSASNHFYFFAYGGNPTNTRYPLRGKLYYLKIYSQTGTLIHEYVPCTNGAGVAGLYDTIGGAFYSSETSTALSVE